MLGGAFRLDPLNASLVLALLPEMVHIRASNGGTTRLAQIVGLIMDECSAGRPGKEMVLQRFLDMMLVECAATRASRGQTARRPVGDADTALARVLRAMHSDVRAGWTVAEVSEAGGRIAISLLGAVLTKPSAARHGYLLRWRITLAQDALNRGGNPLDRVARKSDTDPRAPSAPPPSTVRLLPQGVRPAQARRNRASVKLPLAKHDP
jgi:hypothetical protein